LTMVFFGMGGWRFMADSWRMGLQKLITVLDIFHTYKGGVRVGFINTNDIKICFVIYIAGKRFFFL